MTAPLLGRLLVRIAAVAVLLGVLHQRFHQDPEAAFARARDLGLGLADPVDPRTASPFLMLDFEEPPPAPGGPSRVESGAPVETAVEGFRSPGAPAPGVVLQQPDLSDLAHVVDTLTSLGARLIVLDLEISPDTRDRIGLRRLELAMRRSKRVVLVAPWQLGSGPAGGGGGGGGPGDAPPESFLDGLLPPASLRREAVACADDAFPPMRDGCTRFFASHARVDGGEVPHLSILLARWLDEGGRSGGGSPSPVPDAPATPPVTGPVWINTSMIPPLPRLHADDLLGLAPDDPRGAHRAGLVAGRIVLVRSADTPMYTVPLRPPDRTRLDAAHSWLVAAGAHSVAGRRWLRLRSPLSSRGGLAFLLVIALLMLGPGPLLRMLGLAAAAGAIRLAAPVLYHRGEVLDVPALGWVLAGLALYALVEEGLRRVLGLHHRSRQLQSDLETLRAGMQVDDDATAPARRAVTALARERVQAGLPDHYEIRGEIGGGGMGIVFEALDRRCGEAVAIKVLGTRHEEHRSFVKRFMGEIETLRKLDHPGIVRIRDHAREPIPWFAMDHVPGRSLDRVLGDGGRLPAERAFRLALRIAEVLAHVHERRIIHRDIKPSNVMVLEEDAIRLLDFGIAREEGRTLLTATGDVLGTFPYMSPEQAGGTPAGAPSDVYSLGIVLIEMLLGRLIERQGLFHQVPVDELLEAGVPGKGLQVLVTMLAGDPRARPASGAEAAGAFGSVLALLERETAGA